MGGDVDEMMMRIVDMLYSLPFIFFVIMLVVFFGRNFVLMFLAVGAVLWLDMARIVRGQALSIRRQEYVQAAEALGVSSGGILLRHIVPNTPRPVVIYMTLLVPQVIILESFLSFLGLGVQEPMTSWGVLISQGAKNIGSANWLLHVPRPSSWSRRSSRSISSAMACATRSTRRIADAMAGNRNRSFRSRSEGVRFHTLDGVVEAVKGINMMSARRDGRRGGRIGVRQEPDHDGGDGLLASNGEAPAPSPIAAQSADPDRRPSSTRCAAARSP
jgi:hypothetical protein